MGERDWHELYLRGLMSQLDLERYEGLVYDRGQLAEELTQRLEQSDGWDSEMVGRARALLAVRETFAELLADDAESEPLSEDLFSWPVEEAARTLQDRTVIRLVNVIIVRSIQDGVDEVRIEPSEQGVRVDASIDGLSRQLLTTPRSLLRPLLTRLKRVARLDASARGIEQVGRMPVRYCGVDYEVKVTVRPGAEDESARLEFFRP